MKINKDVLDAYEQGKIDVENKYQSLLKELKLYIEETEEGIEFEIGNGMPIIYRKIIDAIKINKENTEKIYCAFCGEQFTKEMLEVYEDSYGCESGCPTVCVDVICSECGRTCYEKSEFGSVFEETTEEEWNKIIEMVKNKEIKDIKQTK